MNPVISTAAAARLTPNSCATLGSSGSARRMVSPDTKPAAASRSKGRRVSMLSDVRDLCGQKRVWYRPALAKRFAAHYERAPEPTISEPDMSCYTRAVRSFSIPLCAGRRAWS